MPSIYYNEWPQYSPPDQARRENSLQAAKLMMNAAFTAPVMGGVAQVEGAVIWGYDDQEKIARQMEKLALVNKSKRWQEMFKSEAVMARECDAIVLIGNYRAADTPLDVGCGLCGGKPNCDFIYNQRKTVTGIIDHTELQSVELVNGPLCMCRVSDLGEAIGAAMAIANRLLVDARPFMSVGLAAIKEGFLRRSEIAVGIPVATQGKNPFMDILPNYHLFSLDRVMDNVRRTYVVLRQVFWYDYRTGFRSATIQKEDE
jgi:uncharacterized ferredoxin-like protein